MKGWVNWSLLWTVFILGMFFGGVGTYLWLNENKLIEIREIMVEPTVTPRPTLSAPPARRAPAPPPETFNGPQLFEAVNRRRKEYGVGALARNDDLCSLASYRLNQMLPAGTIDNHKGFMEIAGDKNSPFAYIFERYNITEFLIYLYPGSATDAVQKWDETLGHRKLLNGGEYTIGCTYAQNGIGVAIVGY